jgi:hypothetical protein
MHIENFLEPNLQKTTLGSRNNSRKKKVHNVFSGNKKKAKFFVF